MGAEESVPPLQEVLAELDGLAPTLKLAVAEAPMELLASIGCEFE